VFQTEPCTPLSFSPIEAEKIALRVRTGRGARSFDVNKFKL
jgi:hypothetical protein